MRLRREAPEGRSSWRTNSRSIHISYLRSPQRFSLARRRHWHLLSSVTPKPKGTIEESQRARRFTELRIPAVIHRRRLPARKFQASRSPPRSRNGDQTQFNYCETFLLHFCSVYGSHGAND